MATPTDPLRRRAIWERDRGVCGICRDQVSPEVMHLDHIVPLSLGGSDDDSNLRPTHARCNMERGNGRVPRSIPLPGQGKYVAKVMHFPPSIEDAIAATAERERRTFTAQVLLWVERGMHASEGPRGDDFTRAAPTNPGERPDPRH